MQLSHSWPISIFGWRDHILPLSPQNSCSFPLHSSICSGADNKSYNFKRILRSRELTMTMSSLLSSAKPTLTTVLSLLSLLIVVSSVEAFTGRASCKSIIRGSATGALNMVGSNPCPEIPLKPKTPGNGLACLACGWFWHPQRHLKDLDGVVDCIVGYTGMCDCPVWCVYLMRFPKKVFRYSIT